MKMFCEECEEKLEIKKQIDEIKKYLENSEWSLATKLWKHNTNVNLLRAKDELDRLMKNMQEKKQ